MEDNEKFYFKFFLILIIALFVWMFGSKKNVATNISFEKLPISDKPAALTNFSSSIPIFFQDSENISPKRDWAVPFLELDAEAALAIKIDGSRVYYNKNIETQRPIASLTKLMTAIVVLENYDLNQIIKIPLNAVKREGSAGDLNPSELITVRSLLGIMLIDSSNDAAFALSKNDPNFISLMNNKAKEIDLNNTHFTNPDGIDEPGNYSSALDIAKIFGYLIIRHPEAFEIMKTKDMVVYSSDGKIEHRLQNTNELLGKIDEVVAGKTGYTDKAGGSLILLIKGGVITVVLGSPNRFGESEKLINWLKKAYIWEK